MSVISTKQLRLALFRLRHLGGQSYECPICGYVGPFGVQRASVPRPDAVCPGCGALERHRLQFLALQEVLSRIDASGMKLLHFAPEPLFRTFFVSRLGAYETADLVMEGVDHRVDLQKLPFADASYDIVFASHVLEHVSDDAAAISEIRRILRPSGIAVLPVPIVADRTVEYGAPNPHEDGHVRAPGLDYFDRYRKVFTRVDTYASDSWPERHQLFVFEDRTGWPTAQSPQRPAMAGHRHFDFVPVCHA